MARVLFIELSKPVAAEELRRLELWFTMCSDFRVVFLPVGATVKSGDESAYHFAEKYDCYEYSVTCGTYEDLTAFLKEWHKPREESGTVGKVLSKLKEVIPDVPVSVREFAVPAPG